MSTTTQKKPTIADLMAEIEALRTESIALRTEVAQLTARKEKKASERKANRNYGPKSLNPMTEEIAYKIKFGHYCYLTVNQICDLEGLSRGQVYSCKEGYTFKGLKKVEETVTE